jgi:hypothetical protein
MGTHSTHDINQLLVAWNQGGQKALEDLSVLLDQERRQLARRFMTDERQDHLLKPTTLVNGACLRLIDWRYVERQNRAHFFGLAGLSLDETAEALKVSVGTVRRDRSLAEARLYRGLTREEQPR